VPECLQADCEPGRIAAAAQTWLDDTAAVGRLQNRFIELHHQLRADTAQLATDAIAPLLVA
jgi:lipid-A-disaccharide synthase